MRYLAIRRRAHYGKAPRSVEFGVRRSAASSGSPPKAPATIASPAPAFFFNLPVSCFRGVVQDAPAFPFRAVLLFGSAPTLRSRSDAKSRFEAFRATPSLRSVPAILSPPSRWSRSGISGEVRRLRGVPIAQTIRSAWSRLSFRRFSGRLRPFPYLPKPADPRGILAPEWLPLGDSAGILVDTRGILEPN